MSVWAVYLVQSVKKFHPIQELCLGCFYLGFLTYMDTKIVIN